MFLLGYERAMDYYQTPLQGTINGGFKSIKEAITGPISLFIPKYMRSSLKTHNRSHQNNIESHPFSDHSVKSIYFFNILNGNPIPSAKTNGVFPAGPFLILFFSPAHRALKCTSFINALPPPQR